MFKLLKYLKQYTGESLAGPVFKLIEALLELFVPLVVADIIDNGIAFSDRGYILRKCLLLAGLSLTGLLFSVIAQLFAARASSGFAANVRSALMRHIGTLSHSDMDRIGTSTLITRMSADINQVQTAVNMGLRLLLRSPFVVFGAMIMAFGIDKKCAMVFLWVIILLFIVVFSIMLVSLPLFRKIQSNLDKVTGIARENLNGARVVRAFGLEDEEKARFEGAAETLLRSQLFTGRISVLMGPVTYLLINLAAIWLIWRGALQVEGGIISQGEVVALCNYMSQVLVELVKLASLTITITKGLACANRVASVLDTENTLKNGTAKEHDENSEYAVEFDDVTFSYPGTGGASVENISFAAKKGERIGVIGATGSGKSTMVNLIPRLYDPDSGSIKIFGRSAGEYDTAYLRRLIGITPQKAVLFRGSIAENLRWGKPDATEDEMNEAVRIARAADTVEAKGGLDALIEQGGKNLSGGQRQRLCIARAVIGKPPILILDDSSSALDAATDKALREEIAALDFSPLVFIVSQRISSVKDCDRILVFDDGLLVGSGTHEHLLESCPVYEEIAGSQLETR